MTTKPTINDHLKASPACFAVIKAEEGLQLVAYKCPAGVWTAGWGHTAGVTRGMKVSVSKAEQWLHEDVSSFEQDVRRLVRVPLSQGQFDGLVSFVFNVGAVNFADSTLLRHLNAGDYAGAAEEFGKWVYGGGRALPGLVRRRKKERALFEGITKGE